MTSERLQPIVAQVIKPHSGVELVVIGLMFLNVGCVHDAVVQRSCNIISLMYGFVRSVFVLPAQKWGS